MSYKRIELNNLEKMTALTEKQVENVCMYLNTMDGLQQVPLLADALSLHELMYSTNSLLTLTNSLILEQVATAYNKGDDVPTMGHILNIPNAIAHSMNLQELDEDYGMDLDDSEYEEETDEEDDENTAAD